MLIKSIENGLDGEYWYAAIYKLFQWERLSGLDQSCRNESSSWLESRLHNSKVIIILLIPKILDSLSIAPYLRWQL